ncbi:MAG TPA: tetratricopeptide repeat protein, partial [Spirochaetota bacterium]|nr:tetratricopeptide repeat protein [Spirochaetota bacterium]
MKSNLNILQVNAALSAIYYKLGDKEKAIQFAEKAFERDPYNLNAKNSYGYLLCEYDLDVPKGLEMLREVVRVNPTNAAYIDSLGWAYYKKGDIKAAIASLKRALSMSNGNEEIKEHYDIVLGKK